MREWGGDQRHQRRWPPHSSFLEKSSFMTTLKLWPAFEPMRRDPRYKDLLVKLSLPQ